MMIHEVVSEINEALASGLEAEGVTNVVYYGICDSAIVNRKNSQKAFPALFDVKGEGIYPFSDDLYDLGWYHRLISNKYLTDNKSFGRTRGRITESDMYLVVWGFAKALEKSKYETEEIIRKSFLDTVLLQQTVFDGVQIFNREFRGYKYLIRPEEFVFSIQYKVRYRNGRC
ncbi:hypothetical protein [Limibacterium fermenti]|uniref:hypothetical protein n=1 Tax=Limibacterium fermenti TaxID=3229863 RepID=UPI003A683C70